jgi:outer membrane lipoprotein-sorting protein
VLDPLRPIRILAATLRSAVLLVALAAAAALVGASARASDFAALKAKGADAIVAESDRLTFDYPTQQWRFRMTVKAPGDEARAMIMEVWQKDKNKRLVRFVEPGPVKGLSMLSTGDAVMYVYSPQTDNVRRVAAHARRQTMLGSNMDYDDMAQVGLGERYGASFAEETASHQWLELTLKPGAEASWHKLRARVDKATAMVDQIEYLEDGKVKRVQTRSNYAVLDGVPTYRTVEMKTLSDGLTTTVEMLEQKIGLALPDSMFMKKNLVRGR